MKILIFGGTGEARDLANKLVALGHDVTTSLAGRTRTPNLPAGQLRVGGFGGVAQLKAFFEQDEFDRVIDATHPYADKMSAQLVPAAQLAGVELFRVNRPEWKQPEGANWTRVRDANEAMQQLPENGVPFISLGHKEMGDIANWPGNRCVVRLIEAPAAALPSNVEVILTRPPYTLESETALMRERGITHLLTKNSGGDQTRAKIDAAAHLGLVTYMIARPKLAATREVESVEEAIALIRNGAI